MKLKNSRILSHVAFGLGLAVAAPALAQNTTTQMKTETCNVEFKAGVMLEDEEEARGCVTRFEKLRLGRLEVVGYASPGGSEAANRALAQRRADVVAEQMKAAFPDVEITARGAGVDRSRGRTAQVLAYYAGVQGTTSAVNPIGSPSQLGTTTPQSTVKAIDPVTGQELTDESSNSTAGVDSETPTGSITSRPTDLQGGRNVSTPTATADATSGELGAQTGADATVAQADSSTMPMEGDMAAGASTGAASDTGTPLQREDIPSGWNDVRVAGRVGYDYQWDRKEYMNSAGIDASYVRRNLGTRLARLEAGATASFLGDPAEDLKAFNFHGTLFPALEVGPLVFGPRGLLGGSWEDTEKEVVIDAGGEGRLGVEAANYSIFVAAGRTQNLTRIGLDVGATF